MNLKTETFRFTFLTPCFSGTADGKDAMFSELRVPPIRGHIRFWQRAVYGPESANRIWGSTNGNDGQVSRVAIRIKSGLPSSHQSAQLLPHKPHGQGSRPALPVGGTASIQLQRLPACSNDDWAEALTATKFWLVAGTLGYRSSRAAGSVWPDEQWAPQSQDQLACLLKPLIAKPGKAWAAALIGESAGNTWTQLREAASDTPKGPPDVFGYAKPRKPSPVRFKVIKLSSGLCLLAVGPSMQTLINAEAELKAKFDPHRWNELGAWKFLKA